MLRCQVIMLFKLIVLLVSCSSSQEDSKKSAFIGPFPDTVTPLGIRYQYVKQDSFVYAEIIKGRLVTRLPEQYLENFGQAALCSFYQIRWSNENAIILQRGCGMPPNWDSKIITSVRLKKRKSSTI